MSESVIADFVGKFNSTALGYDQPEQGRILLSKKRLVLAADNDKLTVPLSDIFDVAVGQVPNDFGQFFDSTVTIAFKNDEGRHVSTVEADNTKIEKFSNVLFKALLNGTTMMVKHPARQGGRVTDATFKKAKLSVKGRQVGFKRQTAPFEIDLSTVTDFEQMKREIGGATREVLSVRHMENRQAVTTLAATDSSRKMSLLGRYFRLEYRELMEEIEDIELGEDEVELLVAVYSAEPGMSLASILDKEPSQMTMILNDLTEQDLIEDGPEGTELTAKGQVIVSDKIEDVNV